MTSKTKKNIEYEFTSVGPKGFIKKTILFTLVGYNYYNLAFGEFDKETGKISDNVNSGNNDHEMILATVAVVVDTFTMEHPYSYIYIYIYICKGQYSIKNKTIQDMYHQILE